MYSQIQIKRYKDTSDINKFMSTPNYSFAFQPIIDADKGVIVSFEALVRGCNNEPASKILQQVHALDACHFDEMLRLSAIPLAGKLGIGCSLNLNLLPGSALSSDSAMDTTIAMAEQCGIKPDRITLEITEKEVIKDFNRYIGIMNNFRRRLGVKMSIDDFGAGYSGLNLLAEFDPDSIKLDMTLIRDIPIHNSKQAVVRGILKTCHDLGIEIIAEGVETVSEYWWLRTEGIALFQGYLFAKPEFEQLPTVSYPQ